MLISYQKKEYNYQVGNLSNIQLYNYKYSDVLEIGKSPNSNNNTARIKLLDKNSPDRSILKIKILLYCTENYAIVDGVLEINASFAYPNYELGTFKNKKINVISDTKFIKCLNIDFEVVNKEYVDLVIRYNTGYVMMNLEIFTDRQIVNKSILSLENISEITNWY